MESRRILRGEEHDLILYAKATVEQASIINQILDDFGIFFGHKVNKLKSHVYFSPNMDIELATSVSSKLGIAQVDDLVLTTIPTYFMQVCRLLQCVCSDLESRLIDWRAPNVVIDDNLLVNDMIMANGDWN
ncbi:hypothetical protein V6N12_017409 [Hibiscus sabdariffa]|uniref:Reverse transcriptase domain-containing protein n=1 Tax=Hibiscus sabdariffa TaxID=183260 RepID=A0ABR2CFE4_9ROSI